MQLFRASWSFQLLLCHPPGSLNTHSSRSSTSSCQTRKEWVWNNMWKIILRVENATYGLCWCPVGQKSVTWFFLVAREAQKCNLTVGPGGKETSFDKNSCYRAGGAWVHNKLLQKGFPLSVSGGSSPSCPPARFAMPTAREKTSLNARDWWKERNCLFKSYTYLE